MTNSSKMELFKYPERKGWRRILQRPYADNSGLMTAVQSILLEVKQNGDKAIHAFNRDFDGVILENLQADQGELLNAAEQLPASLKRSIRQAFGNIEKFHKAQKLDDIVVDIHPGIICSRKTKPIEKVGLYIPGGTAPLFSTVLMLGIAAKLAGCPDIVLCTPADKTGKIHPAILYTANLVGIQKVYAVGGAQAIAAMAYGTETVPQVYKIFGPGNQYVTMAKQLLQMQGIAIDMPAGPSEVCIIADSSANASFVAADLLSQAEHGADSQVILISHEEDIITNVMAQVQQQLQVLPRREIATKSLSNSKAILVHSLEEAVELANEYAAEHLIINCRDADLIAGRINNAGSIFIGNFSPESAGDYASGTNHTLPTNGLAKAYSGVSVDSFVKRITYQQLTPAGLDHIGNTVIEMAEAEGLKAHAESVRIRLQKHGQPDAVKDGVYEGELSTWDPIIGNEFDLYKLARKNIISLEPYSSARNEYSGHAGIFLDANENSLGSPLLKWYNRYPDPMQWELKRKIATIKNIDTENILLGNGSDECIDLLIRAFCDPGKDNIIICPPTYGMYQVCAGINDVEVKNVLLTPAFQLDMDLLETTIDASTKMIFFCSPNNPTGNTLDREDIEIVLNNFNGIVVIDEAYINFSRHRSLLAELKDYPNLVILQTLSKAWGLAGLRLGLCMASVEVIDILNRIKPPYNINRSTQELVLKALDNLDDVNEMIRTLVNQREFLKKELAGLPFVKKIYNSDANFLLVKMEDGDAVYEHLKSNGIIVRNRGRLPLCENCLRITIGTEDQNRRLVGACKEFKQ